MYKITNCFLIFMLISSFVFAETGSRVIEYTGNFSYSPPLGWTVSEFPGLKYKVIFGPTENRFAVNICFVDENFNGNLRDYTNYNISHFSVHFNGYKFISRNEFITNSGIIGECVIINTVQEGNLLKQVFYIFPLLRNKYIVITCSTLDNTSSRYLSIFEESIKTFELLNK